jgi:hypothetical protein
MGLFSFFSRKKKRSQIDGLNGETSHGSAAKVIERQWHHNLEHLTVVTHPLGDTRGTDLDHTLIMSSLVAMSQEISLLAHEEQSLQSLFRALSLALTAKAAAEDISLESVDVLSLSGQESVGYSARALLNGRRFTILLGDRAAVGRASTPFAAEISAHLALEIADTPREDLRHPADESSARTLVLAIDGISYAAVTTSSQLR